MTHAKPAGHRAFDPDADAPTAWAQSNPVLLVLACFLAFAAVAADVPVLAQEAVDGPQFLNRHLHSVTVGLVTAGLLSVVIVGDALLGALLQAGHDRRPALAALRDELRFTTRVGLAVVATALL